MASAAAVENPSINTFASAAHALTHVLSKNPSTPYDITTDWCPSQFKLLFPNSTPSITLTPNDIPNIRATTIELADNKTPVPGVPTIDLIRDSFSAMKLSKTTPDDSTLDGPVQSDQPHSQLTLEQKSQFHIPLSTLPSPPLSTTLPTHPQIHLALSKRRLAILPIGTAGVTAPYSTYTDAGDQSDEDKEDEENVEDTSRAQYNYTISRLESLISQSSQSLPQQSLNQHAVFALHAAAAWGVGLTERASLLAVESLFASSHYTLKPAKRKSHTVVAHVGPRNWAANFYGLGMAVETKSKIVVTLKSNTPPPATDPDFYKIGECVCTFVQGLPFHPAILPLHVSDELSFVDTDSPLDQSPPPPPVTASIDQGYVRISFVPYFGDGANDDDLDDDFEPQQVDENAPLPHLPEDDVSDTASVTSSTSSSFGPRIPLSTLTAGLGIGYDPDQDRPLPGLASSLYVFGDNDCNCLALPRGANGRAPELIFTPHQVHLATSSIAPSNAIASISCSALHTIISTTLGAVYTCGDGSDGQLGHGVMRSTTSFKLVEWFAGRFPPPQVKLVSAASHTSGSHTAAVDEEGKLYTWGKGSACGHIGSSSLSAAATGSLSSLFNTGTNYAEGGEGDTQQTALGPVLFPRVVTAFKKRPVIKVSCGGGFTLCIAASAKGDSPKGEEGGVGVYAWGLWAQGRLGLGKTPTKVDSTYLHANTRRKIPRFLARPRKITSLDGHNVLSISAGHSHSLCITSKGEVFAWGQNDGGQCSVVPLTSDAMVSGERAQFDARVKGSAPPVPPSVWDDVLTPRRVVPFIAGRVFATTASAGTLHSAVVDSENRVWTWGGGGHGACLGHGECSDEALAPSGARMVMAQRMNVKMGGSGGEGGGAGGGVMGAAAAAAAAGSRRGGVSSSTEAWGSPRIVKALLGYKIEKVSCGEAHCAVVSSGGSMLCWGGGVGVVQVKEEGNEDMAEKLERGSNGLADIIEPVCVPREPCTTWLGTLSGKVVSDVCCGGQHTACLSIGEKIGAGLGRRLLKAGALTKKIVEEESDSDSEGEFGDNPEEESDGISAVGSSIFSSKTSLMQQGATADCVLLVAGRRIYCHLVVLSKRSSVLRDMIYEEFRGGEEGFVELILPELGWEVARRLVQYLYSDDVVLAGLDVGGSVLVDLEQAGEKYGLKRLVGLCRKARVFARAARGGGEEEGDVVEGSEEVVEEGRLGMDLGAGLGEAEFADVKFVCGEAGKSIYAHKCILSARSAYFAAMFRSAGGAGGRGKGVVEVQVPDSYVSLLRLLVFIYCGQCGEGSADALLEDLLSADRYQLWDMKKMCESMIKVDVGNCVSVLDVAVVVGAERLKSEALSVLSRKLGGVGELEGWREMMDELGGRVGGEVMGELVGLLVEKERQKLRVGGGVSDVEKGVVDAGLAAGREVSLSVEVRGEVRKRWLLKKEMEKESVEELIEGQGLGVNMIVGLGLVVLMGVYLKLSKVIVLGPIVPVVNIVFLLGFMGRAAYSLRGDVGKRGKGKKRRSLR